MIEKQFIKAINSKNNENGNFTYTEVQKLLTGEYSRSILAKINNIYNKNIKTPRQIINDNFELIIEKISDEYINTLILRMLSDKEMSQIIEKNFYMVLNKINHMDCDVDEIFEKLNKSKCLEKNIDCIFQEDIAIENLFKISEKLKGISIENDEKLNRAIESKKIEFAKMLIEDRMSYIEGTKGNLITDKQLNEISLTLSIMIQEILDSEKCNYIDIKRIQRGGYSDVYKIGQKILKVSENRQVYEIPNHRRILQPLTRTKLIIDEKNNKSIGCIEICELVDTLKKRDCDKEKLYSIYKELRDDGIIWTDARFENIGVLRNDNVSTLNGEIMYVSPNSVGFDKLIEDKDILKKGEWIILDTDYLYKEGDPNLQWSEVGFSKEFGLRYIEEKQKGKSENKINITVRKHEDDIILE